MRIAEVQRKTKETNINLSLEILESNLPGAFLGTSGIGFFDHMLSAFAVHGGFKIDLKMTGDLFVDAHHSVEDVGIVLGKAFEKILNDKCGIKRFCDLNIPMDEALCFCAVDVSGRAFLVFDSDFKAEKIGEYDTQLTTEFMRALSQNAGITLHLKKIYGQNDHHVTEALYKACGKALGNACQIVSTSILSSKGIL